MSSIDGSYRVDLEHLEQVTARVHGLAGFVEDSMAGLDARTTTAHQQWSGVAAEKHAAAHRDWMNAATTVRDGIAAMHAAAKTAHEAYTATVAANNRALGI
jgi:WXG100 family type VII secretion target